MVNLLLEGIDRCGKSRFLQNWISHYPYFSAYRQPHASDEEFIDLLAIKLNEPECKIYDRSHISEIAYSYMYRGQEKSYLYQYEALITVPTVILFFEPFNYMMLKSNTNELNTFNPETENDIMKGFALDSSLPVIFVHKQKGNSWRNEDIVRREVVNDLADYLNIRLQTDVRE